MRGLRVLAYRTHEVFEMSKSAAQAAAEVKLKAAYKDPTKSWDDIAALQAEVMAETSANIDAANTVTGTAAIPVTSPPGSPSAGTITGTITVTQ